ncbi:MAG: hypothetical protein AAB309_03150 [Deltaproteobacteria bacterium]
MKKNILISQKRRRYLCFARLLRSRCALHKISAPLLLTTIFFLSPPLQNNCVAAENVSNAKAAELALHRIDRLVAQNKIDKDYLLKLRDLKLSIVPQESPDNPLLPKFGIMAETYAAKDGTKKRLEIWMNAKGKVLDYKPLPGGEPDGAPTWPDTDPVTLAENALHRILDNVSVVPSLVPFFNSLIEFTISPLIDETGSLLAQIDALSSEGQNILRVFIALDGTFKGEQYLPKNFMIFSGIGGLSGASR